MGGIAGVAPPCDGPESPGTEQLAAMAGTLRQRGPEEWGIYRDHRAGLDHARRSSIDLTTGQQPLANGDEVLWIVLTGEIFTYMETPEERDAFGQRFRPCSDTEVVVDAYEAWGERASERFNGQFVVALWNRLSSTIVRRARPSRRTPVVSLRARRPAVLREHHAARA
jgi:asparagine synthase (glutamine-hydrolysing)